MRRSLLVAVVSLGLSFVSAVLLAAGKPNPCPPDVKNLVADILTRTSDSSYNIVGDGQSYTNTNAKGKITLLFQNSNCSYDFTMNLFQSPRRINVFLPSGQTTAWFFNFDRIGSVPRTDAADFLTGLWCTTFSQDRSFQTVDGKPLDNYQDCDTDAGGAFARRRADFSLANDYGLAFQYSPFEVPYLQALTSGTSYIKVYHPEEKVWYLEPEGSAISALFQSTTAPPLSTPVMPFRIEIRQVP